MSISFVQPILLLFLLLLVPLWVLVWVGQSPRSQVRRRVATWRVWTAAGLRSVIFVALVFALAGAQWMRTASDMTTVFVLDSSDSVGPAARAQGEAYIAEALRRMPPGDRASVVVFGADAVVERPPSGEQHLDRLQMLPDRSATDIGGALRLGLATLPADSERRVVLLSDGAETRHRDGAGALDVAAQARAAGIPIETVSLAGPPASDDVAVEALEAPATAREGQTLRLVVQVRSRSSAATRGRLVLLRDRQPVLDTSINLPPGISRVPLLVRASRGFHTWEARVEAPGDGVGANNVAFGFSDVRGPPRVLLVEGAPGRASNLLTAATAAGLQVESTPPDGLPQTLATLDTWDAIVLVDAPFRALPPAGAKLLPTYVRELGHGLLMVGGEDSYAAGGYGDTPVETALPVTMRTRGAEIHPDLALVLVIDRSGSMSGEKLNLAKEGVAQSYAALDERDQVGVIAFDTSASWVLPLQVKPSVDDFLVKLGAVAEGGGTDLRPGLEQATDALEHADAKIKHVVLLTDGQADQNYDDVVARMKRDGITLSTVGVGPDADTHLGVVAAAGGGRFYSVLNFNDIPRLFFDETIRVARRGIVEETFTPRLTPIPGPAGSNLREMGGLAPLYGYNAVTARESAQVSLVSPTGDPILAEWQYGLGRAAAWTSDMQGKWGRDWVAGSNFGRFAAQLIDALVPRQLSNGFETSASVTGTALSLDLRADAGAALSPGTQTVRAAGRLVAPDGQVLDVPMTERDPGHYQGTIPLPDPGVYRVQIVATAPDGTGRIVAASGAVVPPSAEYLNREGNPGLLKAIADATGGQTAFPAANAFARPERQTQRSSPLTWPLLWLAILLWPVDIAVRRLLLPALAVPALARLRARVRALRSGTQERGDPARAAEARQRARRRVVAQIPSTAPVTPSPQAGTPVVAPTSPSEGQRPPAETPHRPGWRDTRRNLPERPAERRRDG